jgi:hypothetical protein
MAQESSWVALKLAKWNGTRFGFGAAVDVILGRVDEAAWRLRGARCTDKPCKQKCGE